MVTPTVRQIFAHYVRPIATMLALGGVLIGIVAIIQRNDAQQHLIEQLRAGLSTMASNRAVCPSTSASPSGSVEVVPVARAMEAAACPCARGQRCDFLDKKKAIEVECSWRKVRVREVWEEEPAASASANP